MARGSFIISLDFELHWGVRDVLSVSEQKDHFLRAREAIPEMLRVFTEYEVHATWATVGFLFARNKRHLLNHLPEIRPTYTKGRLDPYPFLEEIGEDERSDPLHYAPSLLQAIAEVPGQDIASHTFSHYYCLEEGQTEQAFEADLRAAAAIGEPFGKVMESLVFPRGQYNPAYSSVLGRVGVGTYRISPALYPYRPRRADEENLAQRTLRLLDSYVPISGSHGEKPSPEPSGVVPLRAGIFLRPYSRLRRRIEPIRLHRIKRAMREAAQQGRDLHVWWHPHNFGSNTRENLAMLDEVLREHRFLKDRYGWPSRNMGEAAREVKGHG
jgi:peptidoglycan/xylan/chitin deacetylase (PgdA/CDA1 family)